MELKGHKITPGSIINLSFGILERGFSCRWFNLWKTIYLNFRMLPFKQAVRLPIFVWGGLKIVSLIGKAEIKGQISTGMIKFGLPKVEEFIGHSKSVFSNQGTLIFNGDAEFFNGFFIRINKGKKLEFGENVMCSSNVTFFAIDDIKIGDEVRIAYQCVIMSSDMHYSVNTNNGEVYNNSAPIIIGHNNWITSGVKIMKGTTTPPWTIVTAGSLLNKDYTEFIPPESIIGGTPAKLIKSGQRRIFSLKSEQMLREYFVRTGVKKFVPDNIEDFDSFCKR